MQRKFDEKLVNLEQENKRLKFQFMQVNNTDRNEESIRNEPKESQGFKKEISKLKKPEETHKTDGNRKKAEENRVELLEATSL